MSTRERLAAVIGPIILIAIGVILLLNQFDIISVDLWSLFFGLWPLLVIALALSMLLSGGSIFLPLTLIVFSMAFLLSNYELVDWNMWEMFAKLWPVLLIALGLDIMVLPRMGLASSRVEEIDLPLDNATSVEIKIDGGLGKLVVNSEAGSDSLVTATATVGQSEHLKHSLRMKDADAFVKIKRSANWYYPFTGAWTGSKGCQVSLNPTLSTSLKVDGGFGNKVLDLRDANLTRLKVDGGLGSADITLPSQGQFTASIDGGIGDNTIRIPTGLAVSIRLILAWAHGKCREISSRQAALTFHPITRAPHTAPTSKSTRVLAV